LRDQIIEGALQSKAFTDVFRRRALFDPDFVYLVEGMLITLSLLSECGVPIFARCALGGRSQLCWHRHGRASKLSRRGVRLLLNGLGAGRSEVASWHGLVSGGSPFRNPETANKPAMARPAGVVRSSGFLEDPLDDG
jgi:hypothetical protein